jgi:ubiquinone/menaquinone biosynthesis C-methylase UbiE
MIKLFQKIYNRLSGGEKSKVENAFAEFNKSNPLGGNGERVDITYTQVLEFMSLDLYQKSHFKRYEFALELINYGEVCGDFACGTGYGSVMLATKASSVVGMDINRDVISKITERYKDKTHVKFIADDLLNLKYDDYLDTIVSFETVEHFTEADIDKLMSKFWRALKSDGRLIFSTPYMQERSEAAEKMGFHLTFYFDEDKIAKILGKHGFEIVLFKYQNYDTHEIIDKLEKKDFIICVAKKTT